MLFGSRARRDGLAFLIGWILATAVVLTLLIAFASTQQLGSGDSPSDTVSWIKLVLGVVLIGLAVKGYAHSTAPNRRYPDLVTQRLVKAALAGGSSPYPLDELHELARHCTEQEDDAVKIERQVVKSAAALLLAPRKGDRFEGIVTGASSKGTWVRVLRPPAEGRVVRGEKGMDVGERVTVKLVDVDVEKGFIDFARA